MRDETATLAISFFSFRSEKSGTNFVGKCANADAAQREVT
jgi:hypothetical protein